MRFNPLPLLFIAAPLMEIVTFGLVVGWLGFWSALGLVLLTSAIGFLIVRQQGFGLVSKVTAMMREGRPPETGMGGDLVTILAGILLLIPGFLTDVIGLLLLLPFVRKRIVRMPGVKTRTYTAGTYTETYRFNEPRRADEGVVDLDAEDFHRVDKGDPNKGRNRLTDR